MRHEDCSNWEYTTHPDYQSVAARCARFLDELRVDPVSKAGAFDDTRPFHHNVFESVAPKDCPFLAGSYRGADFPCLRGYPIYFGGHEGTLPVAVQMAMEFYHSDLRAAVDDLDAAINDPISPLVGAPLLFRVVEVAATLLTRFFTIHPYANGNGHMGRLVVWVFLAKYKRLPVKWWLHESPPGYGPLLSEHRAGRPKPLQRYLLNCIRG